MSFKNIIRSKGKVSIAVRNMFATAVFLLAFTAACHLNDAYNWMWNVYLKQNTKILQSFGKASKTSMDDRMKMKLGEDYQYVMFLRDATPTNAVVFYPSLTDFTTVMPGNEKSPFTGILTDKLSAIRILYPRRVVQKNEMGRTPWSFKITHVAIVNRRNADVLPYPVPQDYYIGILPMDSTMISY